MRITICCKKRNGFGLGITGCVQINDSVSESFCYITTVFFPEIILCAFFQPLNRVFLSLTFIPVLGLSPSVLMNCCPGDRCSLL